MCLEEVVMMWRLHEMSARKGPFRMYEKNKKHMMRVIRNHRYAAYNTPLAFEGLNVSPGY